MRLQNFKLVDPSCKGEAEHAIEIDVENKVYDLHNGSEFWQIQYNLREKNIILDWLYYSDEGQPLNYFLRFICHNVTNYSISNRNISIPAENDDILDEMIIKEKSNIVIFNYCSSRQIEIQTMHIECQLVIHNLDITPNP